MDAMLLTACEPGFDLQTPMAAAVVMPTLLRPSLVAALRSIYAQKIDGRVHVLIGIDQPQGDREVIQQALAGRPPHVAVQVFYPGFSTSIRHGGLSPARDGGALRCVLSQLANAAHVAYLDDDNWWAQGHLAQMSAALRDHDAGFAWSYRWFVHPHSLAPICIDTWESVGAEDRGIFAENAGGFIDPNCLMIDKTRCPEALQMWQVPLPGDSTQMTSDRSVFAHLRANHRGVATGHASSYYRINPDDALHALRVQLMAGRYEAASLFG